MIGFNGLASYIWNQVGLTVFVAIFVGAVCVLITKRIGAHFKMNKTSVRWMSGTVIAVTGLVCVTIIVTAATALHS
jgi:hypothetical protein